MPGKPDPVSSLFSMATGVTQGAGMDAKAGNSWFNFDFGTKTTPPSTVKIPSNPYRGVRPGGSSRPRPYGGVSSRY